METFVLDYISKLEGIKTRIKEIHWEESTISGHELAGDVETMICDFEDAVAEDLQGVFGEDIKVKSLEPKECNANTQKELLDELKSATLEFYKKLDGDNYIGARSEVEGFIHELEVKKYLVNKTTSKINESKLVDILTESLVEELESEVAETNNMAKKIFMDNNLIHKVDWEAQPDAEYDEDNLLGLVEYEGWEFTLTARDEIRKKVVYPTVDYSGPNGEFGSFELGDDIELDEGSENLTKLSQEELDEVIKIAAKMVLDGKK